MPRLYPVVWDTAKFWPVHPCKPWITEWGTTVLGRARQGQSCISLIGLPEQRPTDWGGLNWRHLSSHSSGDLIHPCPGSGWWQFLFLLSPLSLTSLYLNHCFRDPISKYSHYLSSWGLGLQHKIGGWGIIILPIPDFKVNLKSRDSIVLPKEGKFLNLLQETNGPSLHTHSDLTTSGQV